MSMRAYMVLSFALMAVLGAVLTLNWWNTVPPEWCPVRLVLAALGVVVTLCSAVMVLVAAMTTYRKP